MKDAFKYVSAYADVLSGGMLSTIVTLMLKNGTSVLNLSKDIVGNIITFIVGALDKLETIIYQLEKMGFPKLVTALENIVSNFSTGMTIIKEGIEDAFEKIAQKTMSQLPAKEVADIMVKEALKNGYTAEAASNVLKMIANKEITEETAVLILKQLRESESTVEEIIDLIKQVEALVDGTSNLTANLLKKSTCTQDELYNYLLKNSNADDVKKFLNDGIWPEGTQIPKSSAALNPDGSIDWSKAPEGGYTLKPDGSPDKESFVPNMDTVIDRYGKPDGRYTSPVVDGNAYSYTERSLPYVEDLSSYHQYKVTGDFSRIEDYVNNCPDTDLKAKIDALVTQYYDGDYSKLSVYKGTAAKVDGWGSGGAIQYEFPLTVEQLEKIGLLEKLN